METGYHSRKEATLSFVIPLKDEAPTLGELFEKIAEHASAQTSLWEVIFVDDGSTDNSWEVIQGLAAENPDRIKAIRFRRSMGKGDALAAGWQECSGDFVFTMDADLQDDPAEIPNFLKKMEEGWDIVSGWKRRRHDPWHKVLPSRIFNLMLSRVNKVKLHDHNCGFKCYRREVVQAIPMYGEMHRMVPSLAAIHGYRTTEIPVQHHPRVHGRSKTASSPLSARLPRHVDCQLLAEFSPAPIALPGQYGTGDVCRRSFVSGSIIGASVAGESGGAIWTQRLQSWW